MIANRAIFALLPMLVAAASQGAASPLTTASAAKAPQRHRTEIFTIDLPPTWQLLPDEKPRRSIAFADLDPSADPERAPTIIMVERVPAQFLPTMSATHWGVIQLRSAMEKEHHQLETVQKSMLDGYPAECWIARGKMRGYEIKSLTTCAVRYGLLYKVTFAAALEDFDRRLPEGREILKSFRFAPPAPATRPLRKLTSYDHEPFKFRIKYPLDWEVYDGPERKTIAFAPTGGPERVSVSYYRYPRAMDLEHVAWRAVERTGLRAKEVEVVTNKPAELAGHPARQLVIECARDHDRYRAISLITIVGREQWAISSETTLDRFDAFASTFKDMTDSLKVQPDGDENVEKVTAK